MELSIAASGGQLITTFVNQPPSRSHFHNSRKWGEKQEVKKGGKPFSMSEVHESMNITLPVRIKGQSAERNVVEVTPEAFKQTRNNKFLTLKEMREKKYPFLDSDVTPIFKELVKLKLIELPEMKRPNEATMVNDPNYYKYHRLVGHPIEKCLVFKDKVMKLAHEGKIELSDSTDSANQISVTFGRFAPLMEVNDEMGEKKSSHAAVTTIKFGDFDPVQIRDVVIPFNVGDNVKEVKGWKTTSRLQHQKNFKAKQRLVEQDIQLVRKIPKRFIENVSRPIEKFPNIFLSRILGDYFSGHYQMMKKASPCFTIISGDVEDENDNSPA